MQNYDTPRSIKDGLLFVSSVDGNRQGQLFASQHLETFQPPKVKLTGVGKMPVADMRMDPTNPSINHHIQINSNPATAKASDIPVYAVINKTAKSAAKQVHNYCNIDPGPQELQLFPNYANIPLPNEEETTERHYENTRAFMDRLALNEAIKDNDEDDLALCNANYLSMNPADFNGVSDLSQLPIIPFYPVISPQPCDSINRKLRNFHDSLNHQSQALEKHMPEEPVEYSLKLGKSRSIDQLNMVEVKSQGVTGADVSVTLPRYSKPEEASIRRSVSVPCKRPGNRGSTSSSDSGFSPGSPNNVQAR